MPLGMMAELQSGQMFKRLQANLIHYEHMQCRQVLEEHPGTNFSIQLQPGGFLRLDADPFERGVIEGTLTFVSAFFEHDLNDSGRHPQMDGHMHQLLMSSPL
jgi:hypothetical protein